MTLIDPTKPVRLRGGQVAVLLDTRMGHPYPLLAKFRTSGPCWQAHRYTKEGLYSVTGREDDPLNLVNFDVPDDIGVNDQPHGSSTRDRLIIVRRILDRPYPTREELQRAATLVRAVLNPKTKGHRLRKNTLTTPK